MVRRAWFKNERFRVTLSKPQFQVQNRNRYRNRLSSIRTMVAPKAFLDPDFPGRAPRLPEGLPHRPGRAQLTHPVPRDMRLLKAQAYLHTPNEDSMTESFTRRRKTSFVPYTSPSHTQCAPAMLTRLSAALSPLPCWPAARSCLGRSPWLLTGSSRLELPCFQTLL